MDLYIDKKGFVGLIKNLVKETKGNLPKDGKYNPKLFAILKLMNIHNEGFDIPTYDTEAADDVYLSNKTEEFCTFFEIESDDFSIYRDFLQQLLPFHKQIHQDREQNSSEQSTIEKIRKYSSIHIKEDCSNIDKGLLSSAPNKEAIGMLKKLVVRNEKFTSPSKVYYTRDCSWNKLIDVTFPSTDIIIVDPYLFKGENKNIENILDLLLKENDTANVVFFCERPDSIHIVKYHDKYGELKKKWKNAKFTFVLKTFSKDEKLRDHLGIHDRYIITNYRLYMSGHSLSQYYNSDGKSIATGGIWFCENSIIDEDYVQIVSKIIDEQLQVIIRKTEKDEIWGDCECKLLDLPDLGTPNHLSEWETMSKYLDTTCSSIEEDDMVYINWKKVDKNSRIYDVRYNDPKYKQKYKVFWFNPKEDDKSSSNNNLV